MNYCTLFNVNYLTKGLAMITSLQEKSVGNCRIFVLAIDTETSKILKDLNLKNTTVISMSEFENTDLLNVKKDRSMAEYCWTCTPALIRYCMNAFNLSECTYVDADLFFFNDPGILISELEKSGKSVLITPHNYTNMFDQTEASGIFCVQFMYFKNDSRGAQVLEDWYQKCIEWCFARVEAGRFGDQKYLDIWPQEFPSAVHVLNHLGTLAPWNVQRYQMSRSSKKLEAIFKDFTFDVVFYHFHGFNLISDSNYFLGWYPLGRDVKKKIYQPYIKAIQTFEVDVKAKYSGLYQRTYSMDKSHYLLRWLRRKFFETFYILFRASL